MVSYLSDLLRRLHCDCTLPFRMTIGSVILISYIYSGIIMALGIDYISSAFQWLEFLVASRKAWWFVSLSGGERGSRFSFLEASWVIIPDDS